MIQYDHVIKEQEKEIERLKKLVERLGLIIETRNQKIEQLETQFGSYISANEF